MSALPLIAAPLVMAALLIASALVKLRAAERAGLGLHAPSLLELLAALGLIGVLVTGSMTPELGLRTAVIAGILVVGSSLHLGRRLRARRRIRDLTEGRRLEAFVRYLSVRDPNDS